MQVQAARYFVSHFFGRGNEGVPMPPKFAILHGFNQLSVVRHGKRNQLDMLARKLSVLKETVG
jgi:hypothetical protein